MALLWLAVLGGLLALDGTSVGQFMVSRPLVAGTLTGALLGSPAQGLALGALMELFLLASFPMGGARFPEGAPGAVAGSAAAVAAGGTPGLVLGIVVGLVTAEAAGASLVVLRRANERLAPPANDARLGPSRVWAGHLGAVGLDFFRGSVVTGAAAAAGRALGPVVAGAWILSPGTTAGILLVSISVPLGAFLRAGGGFRRTWGVFLSGLVVGGLLGALGPGAIQ